MLNFYDTLYSFCDEEYFPYQTKLREILMYHHRGVGQKWKFVYSYFIWQPFYMLNFYDTSYSFCDEEYFPYQTKLREILMYHLLGWAKSENLCTATYYDNQPIYWTSMIPYTVFATRVYSWSDKALEILMYHHRGVGQKWKFVYSYFVGQPADMLNFYDTSYIYQGDRWSSFIKSLCLYRIVRYIGVICVRNLYTVFEKLSTIWGPFILKYDSGCWQLSSDIIHIYMGYGGVIDTNQSQRVDL